MKHLIAIFSVILTLGGIVSTDVYGGSQCRLHACKIDEDKEELLSQFGQTGNNPYNKLNKSEDLSGELCFHCDAINHDDDCNHNAVVATFDTDNNPFVFYCRSDSWTVDDDWELIPIGNLQECSDSPLQKTAKGKPGVKPNPRLRYKNGDNWEEVTASMHLYDGSGQADGSKVCTVWECESTYTPSEDKKSCIDTNASDADETECEASHGSWTPPATCFCDSGKGLVPKVPGVSRSPCICKDDWAWVDDATGGKCVDPWTECSSSGGTPNGTVCDCTAVEPFKTVSPDGQKCIDNDKYPKCRDSGGDWSDGKCNCDSGKGLDGPRNDECYCKDTGQIYDGTKCVDSPETWCRQTGGEWNATSETCNCDILDKNIQEQSGSSPIRCECKNEDYKFDNPPSNGCVLTDEAKLRIDTFEKLRDACIYDWNMTFTPGVYDRDVDPKDWVCNCDADEGLVRTEDTPSCKCDDSRGYVLDSARTPYRCRLSDYATDKQNCAGATDATWKEDGVIGGRQVGHCECNNKNQMYNYATKKCLDNDTVATWCAMIPGAAVSRDGSCLCRSTKRPPVGYRCPDAGGTTSSTATGSSGPSAGALSAATQKKEQVSSISKKLKEISDSFGRSHWKTASGNFNGARLASDSIAGVVLGTVGGVVTSNIIKKNQVKGGFENLNCTVGGQMVADYGDQFQVGVR